MMFLFPDFVQEKYIAPSQLEKKVQALKKENKTLVTLNGSFDLLHAGHLHMISEAKKQGDCLIVALNSDASIKRYKSSKRPIVPLRERLMMMSALQFVDYVTYFEEDDPLKLLSLIKPHVHVNGSEYGENCIEAAVVRQYGGKIHIVSLVQGLSTSQLIEKIKQVCV